MRLKRCPFCGSINVLLYEPNDLVVVVRCYGCNAEGPMTHGRGKLKRAEKLWNKRFTLARATEVRGERQ